MKARFFLFFLLAAGLCSCSKDDKFEQVESFDRLSADTLWYGHAEASQSMMLKASVAVEIALPDEIPSWCGAEITGTGGGQAVTVHCAANDGIETRYTTIVLKTPRIEQKLVVCQFGVEPMIKVITPLVNLSSDSMILSVPVISTVEYEVLLGDNKWIHNKGIVKGQSADTLKLGLSASFYPKRSGEVLLKWQDLSATITINQVSADTVYNPGGGTLTSKIKVGGGRASHESPGGRFPASYDGTSDYYTSGFVSPSSNIELIWEFEKPEELGKMDYIPYADGGAFWNLGKFNLYVREEGGSDFKALGQFDFQYKKVSSSFEFGRDLKKVDAVKIEVLPAAGESSQWVFVCAEMNFWTRGSDISAIFTDELCADLKEGVTLEQIMAMEDEFYRNLARHLFLGTYDKEFRVQEYQAYMDPAQQKREHKARAWSFLDNPTGIYVKEGDQIVMLAGDTYGEEVKVAIVDWHTVTYRNMSPSSMTSYTLMKGINIFTANKSGLVYIVYNSSSWNGKQPVKINIPTGEVNGYFDIERHDNRYWKSLLNKAGHKFLDVKGKFSQMVFPASDFRTYCPDNIERLVGLLDSVVLLEHQLSGLYKYGRMYPNRQFCKVTYEEDYFMYAYDYHTAYHYKNALPTILDVANLRKDGWGVYHELGHVHQNQNITWRGMTEVSNNIFALFVQTTLGYTSRLIEENRYQEAYDDLGVTGAPHGLPGPDRPFAKVVPMWQLQLYFAKVLNKPDFYQDLYEELRRQGTPSCPQLNYVELCCRIGGMDLTDFFRFYGFFVPISERVEDSVDPGVLTVTQAQIDRALQNIASMSDLRTDVPAIQYLRDDNVALFKNMKAVETGQVALSGSALTLSGWKNVAAWEVYDGGRLVQISCKDKFTLKTTGSGVTVKAVAADGARVGVPIVN